jgi:hypothetical protein
MTAKISSPRRARKSRGVRSIFGQCAAAAVGACLGAISVSAYGADLAVGYSHTVAASLHSAPIGRRSIPARPIDPPDREPNRVVERAALVDQVYDDLMGSSACVLASSKASIGGGCFENSPLRHNPAEEVK